MLLGNIKVCGSFCPSWVYKLWFICLFLLLLKATCSESISFTICFSLPFKLKRWKLGRFNNQTRQFSRPIIKIILSNRLYFAGKRIIVLCFSCTTFVMTSSLLLRDIFCDNYRSLTLFPAIYTDGCLISR